VRTLLMALGLALAACGRTERIPPAAGVPATARRGPDLLVLRAPRSGGPVRVFAFPRLDSLIWTSNAKAPPLDRILGFDDAAGTVLAESEKGYPVRIDLRLGTVTTDETPRLRALSTADGATAFGVAPNGGIVRTTPAGVWSFKPPTPARDVLPQPDGQLLILADRPGGVVLWSVRPPDSTMGDSALLPPISRALRTPLGDRVYFTGGRWILALRVRGLDSLPAIQLPRPANAMVTTPSGDRLFAALDSLPQILILDRYTGKTTSTLTLPAPALSLRMDPFGRVLLARMDGDSIAVIALGTDRVIGVVGSAWRVDLPAVAPNGWVALAAGNDVQFVGGDSLHPAAHVTGGAKDLWTFLHWNGFRPRAAGLDEPVTFPEDTIVPHDTTSPFAEAPHDTARRPADTTLHAAAPPAAPPPAPARDTAPHGPQFTIQFAALRTDSSARVAMRAIHVTGATPRVVPNAHDGVITYRVVIGPFPTREEAERIARTAGMSYWIYEGSP
jgi:cell division septation protein DedD